MQGSLQVVGCCVVCSSCLLILMLVSEWDVYLGWRTMLYLTSRLHSQSGTTCRASQTPHSHFVWAAQVERSLHLQERELRGMLRLPGGRMAPWCS